MTRAALYVELDIDAPMERVWQLTQDPACHSRWDLRFSSIDPLGDLEGGGYRFRYTRRLPFHVIEGLGTAIGEKQSENGSRTSALRFTTDDRLSPLGSGRGYWRYSPVPDGVTFATGYTYEPGWGALVDFLVLRRVIWWMTAWSFDRLRIWAESGVAPEEWPWWSAIKIWRPERPKAARCRRRPRRGRAMDSAPQALGTLEAP